ncbi:MAG TPA: Asp-tRNA(Asn)/Glu-tRNA(Gln) amidotransferase subunit GatA [Bacillota bacterium]|nr:Asp-tRNA(Asn)/Glu-tRNA(Gln) amidotransferase subunit GatA [Bacillota bacterium]HPT62015.1 Asp-tRNA(Asn)/Glu-tRNA(Gln) amidotransferase subunit GatA [Bacillota bacterium]HPZ74085.1 Asp-tRNA(Asn)/Glu-tRNA(Gln) amidotransferase subunit GatA [Bacillota bacterium]
MDILKKSVLELRELLDKGEISSREIVQAYIDRIEKTEPKLNSFVTLTFEEALKDADRADEMIRNKTHTTLTGIPIALKDNISTYHVKTTCSSKMLENYRPPFDATVVKLIKQAGMPILGKTNMDEFAMGSSTETSYFGPTKNPWNLEYVPGGSSGGSAASVAAKQAPLALGTDTGGSIRQPAAFTGIVGIKPTYGLVSRYGVVPFASSLDQVGPFARTVAESAALLSLIAQYDKYDSTSLNNPRPDYLRSLEKDVKGLRVGVPKEFFIDGLDAEVEQAVRKAVKALEDQGAEIVDIELPHSDKALATYYIVATAECSSNLARFDGVRFGHRSENTKDSVTMFKHTRAEGFGPEVKRRIMLGTYALSAGYYDAYYLKALKVRRLIKEDFDKAFTKVDVIITPTTPSTAFKFGEKVQDPIAMYLSDVFTTTANLAGIPALSMPAGLSSNNLPIGVQIIAPSLAEEVMLSTAYSIEKALGSIGLPELEV